MCQTAWQYQLCRQYHDEPWMKSVNNRQNKCIYYYHFTLRTAVNKQNNTILIDDIHSFYIHKVSWLIKHSQIDAAVDKQDSARCPHRHHPVSVAISKLNFFAGRMALTHRSTFVIACYKNGRT